MPWRGLLAWGWITVAVCQACGTAPVTSRVPRVAAETARVVVSRPTVIAFLVVPPGAVDSLPDVAVLADDWNVAMATLGDSLEARGIAFALVTEPRLRIGSPSASDVFLALDEEPAVGYVFAQPGAPPCVRRGPAEVDEVLAAAGIFFGRGTSPTSRAREACGPSRR